MGTCRRPPHVVRSRPRGCARLMGVACTATAPEAGVRGRARRDSARTWPCSATGATASNRPRHGAHPDRVRGAEVAIGPGQRTGATILRPRARCVVRDRETSGLQMSRSRPREHTLKMCAYARIASYLALGMVELQSWTCPVHADAIDPPSPFVAVRMRAAGSIHVGNLHTRYAIGRHVKRIVQVVCRGCGRCSRSGEPSRSEPAIAAEAHPVGASIVRP
jgi:hypothetical protein